LRRDVLKNFDAALNLAGDHDAAYWTKDFYNDLLNENKIFTTHTCTMKAKKCAER